MNKYYWSYRRNDELWFESGDTVDDCIKQAREMNDAGYKTVYIGEGIPFVPSEHINVDVLLDNLEEQGYEFAGEAAEDWRTYEYKKKSEMDELETAIGQIVDAWLRKHGRYPTFCFIDNVVEYSLRKEET